MKRLIIAFFCFLPVCLSAQVRISRNDTDRATDLVSRMTLKEKVSLLGGVNLGFTTRSIPRLGIPSVNFADGPQGVGRTDKGSTLFPCGAGLAATWNRDVAYNVGRGIGLDAKAYNVGLMLCPGVNIYRMALCGRNFEYYGEDPYLSGEMAVGYISGMQDQGVAATIKHFALNNSEFDRFCLSSNADERTKNEIYFPAFRKAVEKAGVGAVMTAYNLVDGVHASENEELIGTLRSWDHKGIVMSDWTSVFSTVEVVGKGVDLEMPTARLMTYEYIKPLIDRGVLQESQIDAKVVRILQTFSAFGLLDKPTMPFSQTSDYDDSESRAAALQAALEGPVLLTNNGILPVRKGRIAILGPNANKLPLGGGSGQVTIREGRLTTFYEGLRSLGRKYDIRLVEPDEQGKYDFSALKGASAVIVAVGYDKKTEKEGRDRTFNLPEGQDELIVKAAEANPNVIVCINAGAEIDLSIWKDRVAAILMMWYGGQESGKALADLVSGKVSPSGRLPFTWWGNLEKSPSYEFYKRSELVKDEKRQWRYDSYHLCEYKEGIFVGYRGANGTDRKPLFPFGYGLGYSGFSFSGATLERHGDMVDVRVNVRNTGKSAAAEVVQVYLSPKGSKVIRPEKELKGFEKIFLAPGQSAAVSITLDADAFKYYDSEKHGWVRDDADFEVLVGVSSEDIRERLPLARAKKTLSQTPDKYNVCAFVWPSCHDDSLARANIWGKGIGEWEVIQQGDPRFEGHYQPKEPLWGYEMDNDPKVVEKWIETALSHGVNTFIYDWYWYEHYPYLESALDDGFLKAPSNSRMNFFIMWANHDVARNYWNYHKWGDDKSRLWTGAIDPEDWPVIVERVISRYFSRPNYTKIAGCPVFALYSPENFIKSFGGIGGAVSAMDYFRAEVRKAGFPDLHLMLLHSLGKLCAEGAEKYGSLKPLGFESWGWYNMGGFNPDYRLHCQNSVDRRNAWDAYVDIPLFPTVSVGWDDTPRFPSKGAQNVTRFNHTPEVFEENLRQAKAYADGHDWEEPFILLNAWNEWIEGSYLLPDKRTGFGYLEAVKRVFGPSNR